MAMATCWSCICEEPERTSGLSVIGLTAHRRGGGKVVFPEKALGVRCMTCKITAGQTILLADVVHDFLEVYVAQQLAG